MMRLPTRAQLRKWMTLLRRNRAHTHAAVLLVLLFAVLLGELTLEVSGSIFDPQDKRQHYQAGRVIAALAFALAYAVMLARLLVTPGKAMRRVLIWLPPAIAGCLVVAVLAALGMGILKEVFDAGGFGQVEWADIVWTLRGATTMIPPGAAVMVVTPFFITLDSLADPARRDSVATGMSQVDDYVAVSKAVSGVETPPAVLLVEDDITCATVVLSFCRAVGLPCRHVNCILDARSMLALHLKSIRVVIADNFVGVGRDGSALTGTQWLRELEEAYPRAERRFVTVIMTGHADFLGDAAAHADLVLKKPWSPGELIAFLKERRIIDPRRPVS